MVAAYLSAIRSSVGDEGRKNINHGGLTEAAMNAQGLVQVVDYQVVVYVTLGWRQEIGSDFTPC